MSVLEPIHYEFTLQSQEDDDEDESSAVLCS